jgi:hypothetical protein
MPSIMTSLDGGMIARLGPRSPPPPLRVSLDEEVEDDDDPDVGSPVAFLFRTAGPPSLPAGAVLSTPGGAPPSSGTR